MLLILMYHRIINPDFTAGVDAFEKHLTYLNEKFNLCSPGDPLPDDKISVCLTFDDAYFDFYHHVFPLLKKYNIPATVAVPTKFILEHTDCDAQTRLNVPYEKCMNPDVYSTQVPFCTWQELREMQQSGLVHIASHSHSHVNLNEVADYENELTASKKILEEKLNTTVTTFIFAFGSVNKAAQEHYRYTMRIGSAVNRGWGKPGQVLYRIDANRYWPSVKAFTLKDYIKFTARMLSNRLRSK